MNVLMVGDIFGEPGRAALAKLLPRLREQHAIDFCVVNCENAAGGFGITGPMAKQMLEQGADVLTSGNHIWDKKEIIEYITKENLLLRPANFPAGTPGVGHVTVKAGPHRVAVVNLMGRVFMSPIDCPFRKADEILPELRKETPIILVDMHCEATSESLAMGWYLDGRVSAVVGTHRHVQTADERVLPGGTAYITDLGMTGPTDGVIGVDREIILQRFLTQMPMRFEPAKGPAATAALAAIDPEKDVDGLHPTNLGRLLAGEAGTVPCTPAGCLEILDHYGAKLEGAEAVVVGRSRLVGKPLAQLLLARHATVTMCHTRTRDLAFHTRRADILCVAAGRPRMVTGDMIKPGAWVIDVGVNRLDTGKLAGDVDFASAANVAHAITPVPGGIGPMTIAMLMKNTLSAARRGASPRIPVGEGLGGP